MGASKTPMPRGSHGFMATLLASAVCANAMAIAHAAAGVYARYLDRLIRDLRLKNRPTLKGCHQHKIREQAHDQIDSFCGLRFSRYHVSSGNDCRASSRAGRYDHASCLGMRTGHDAN
jgi:hypothetical protein